MREITEKKHTVCCIIVTYNRKIQLVECLKALKSQTYIFDAVYIIDNNSNDGTYEHLKDSFHLNLNNNIYDRYSFYSRIFLDGRACYFDIFYLNTRSNLGGAGGFNEGLKYALRNDYDWYWLMDDDTIPTESALLSLLNTSVAINLETADMVGFCCSHVTWNDGKPHKMNIPNVSSFINRNPFNLFLTTPPKAILVNNCSFVSVLLSKKAILQCGLPIKDFFIWNDDVEYTQRISKAGFYGLYVPDSIVIHNTQNNYSATIENIDQRNMWKIFYGTRNTVYMIKNTNDNKIRMCFVLFYFILHNMRMITRSSNRLLRFYNFSKGILFGLFFNPKIEHADK